MRRGLVVAAALTAVAACGKGLREYQHNDLQLVTSYTAKDACSCLFVMEQTEEYCRAWTKASPDVSKLTFDLQARTVESTAFLLWGAKVRYVDDVVGCQPEPSGPGLSGPGR